MNPVTPRPRDFAPDVVRAVAVFLVVLLHLSGSARATHDAAGWADLGLHALSRASVPLFVMLSGWLLLAQPARPIGDFWRRRASRTVWPLLAGSVLYGWWRTWSHGEHWTVAGAAKAFAAGSVYYHLWFLYLILALYVITPFLRTWFAHADRRERRFALGFWIGLLIVPPIVHRLTGPEWLLTGGMYLDYAGYYVLGAWLGARPADSAGRRMAAAALFAGWGATAIGTWILTPAGQSQSELLLDYLRPNIALMSVGAFVLLHSLGQLAAPAPVASVVRWLSRHSLGIYLLHPLLLELGSSGRLGSGFQTLIAGRGPAWIAAAIITLALCGAASSLLSLAARKLAGTTHPSASR
jgi:surface polysaccharide O-acyltransferase-like enzyme